MRSCAILILLIFLLSLAEACIAQEVEGGALCSDEVFLRRAWYSIGGCPPPRERWDAIQDGPLDRAAEVDRIIASEEYPRKWGRWLTWFSGCEEEQLSPAGYATGIPRPRLFWMWLQWSQHSIRQDLGVDKVVHHLVSANSRSAGESREEYYARYDRFVGLLREDFGNPLTESQGPNDLLWKSFRSPEENAELICRRMLGYRLECARCHDHPFADWTQEDHQGMSAVFQRVVHSELPVTRGAKQSLLVRCGTAICATCIILFSVCVSGYARGNRRLAAITGVVLSAVVSMCLYTAAHYVHLLSGQTSWERRGLVELAGEFCGTWLFPASACGAGLAVVGMMAVRRASLIILLPAAAVSTIVLVFSCDVTVGRYTESDSGLKYLASLVIKPDRSDVREVFDDTNGNFRHIGQPRTLDGTIIPDGANDQPRLEFANWLTTSASDQLARNIVNRVTHRLLGNTYVDPVDDFRPGISITAERELEQMQAEFQEQSFSMKWLIRRICLSEKFQSSGHQAGQLSFQPRQLTGEEIIASLNKLPAVEKISVADRWTPTPHDPWSCGNFVPWGTGAGEVLIECQGVHRARQSASFDAVATLMVHPQIMTYCQSLKEAADGDMPSIEFLELVAVSLYGRKLDAHERRQFQSAIEEDPVSGPGDCIWAMINNEDFLVLK